MNFINEQSESLARESITELCGTLFIALLEATHISEIRAEISGWATGTKAAAIGISGPAAINPLLFAMGSSEKF